MSKNKESVNNKTNNEAHKYNAAYGSNLSISQMTFRCPDAEIIGTGKLMDYKLVFRDHADIEPYKGSYVPVIIWSITPADEVRLDRYEGVSGGYYHQEELPVVMDSGEEITAVAYVMNEQETVSPPEAWYYDVIDDGYEHFSFDKKILKKALREACVNHKLA